MNNIYVNISRANLPMTYDANVGTCKSRNLQPLLTTVSVSYGYLASTLTQNDNSAIRSMFLVLPSFGPLN